MAEEKEQDLSNREKILLLFDVDGTLTMPRLVMFKFYSFYSCIINYQLLINNNNIKI